MSILSEEQYKKEYEEAAQALEKAANGESQATTETIETQKEEVKTETVKTENDKSDEVKSPTPEELLARLEKAEKALNDTKAWGTKNAQKLAELERERLIAEREQSKPKILEANPELADAIRYVQSDPLPKQQQEEETNVWQSVIEEAHPNIFSKDIDPELEKALVERLQSIGDAVKNPLVAIREITAVKLEFAEKQVSKRFSIEAEKLEKKQAMSVPSQGGSVSRASVDKDAEEVNRIKNMSDAEFAKEVKKAMGF